YYPAPRRLYCTNWHNADDKGHPGTIMFRRDAGIAYPETGEQARRGEDSAVAQELHRQNGMTILAGMPHLFVYVSHGANTWSHEHHAMLSGRLAVSQGLLRRREADLRRSLAGFDFGPRPIEVHGNNGLAFVLE